MPNFDLVELTRKIFTSPKILKKAFAKHGVKYSYREGQIQMAVKIAEAMENEEINIIEAGTGIGKTMAYLIPGLLKILLHKAYNTPQKHKLIISTSKKTLQDQLMKKDIPIALDIIKLFTKIIELPPYEEIKYTMLKGQNNYICRMNLEAHLADTSMSYLYDPKEIKDPNAIQTVIRELEEMIFNKGEPAIVDELDIAIPLSLLSDLTPQNCLHKTCKYKDICEYHMHRKLARSADMIILNHYLLISDVVRMTYLTGFLPKFPNNLYQEEDQDKTSILSNRFKYHIVTDEAHALESALYNGAIYKADLAAIETIAFSFIPNLITTSSPLFRILHTYLPPKVYKELRNYITNIMNIGINQSIIDLKSIIEGVKDELNLPKNFTNIQRYLGETEEILANPPIPFSQTANEVINNVLIKLRELIFFTVKLWQITSEHKQDIPGRTFSIVKAAIDKTLLRLVGLEEGLKGLVEFISPSNPDETSKWIADKKDLNTLIVPHTHKIVEAVVNSDDLSSLILTSATLSISVGGKEKKQLDFKLLLRTLGLKPEITNHPIKTAYFQSPFNYKESVSLCILEDKNVPSPSKDTKSYVEETAPYLLELLYVTSGHALVLFTSKKALRYMANYLSNHMPNYKFLVQYTLPNYILIQKFKQNPDNTILMGTLSFWEGIDIPGDDLKFIFIHKLPFPHPEDIIQKAKTKYFRKLYSIGEKEVFNEISLPTAILNFKQGFGRLIRTHTDTGAIIVLDNRIVTKRYGKEFINNLPDVKEIRGDVKTIKEELAKYIRDL